MDIGLMVEGQAGLNWERWTHIFTMAERLGFASLFRSDHYFIGTQRDALDPYASLAIAARETSRMRIGPLVSPITFRSPVDVGRAAAHLDLLSGGRFALGVGAGWHEPEHQAYGIPFPPPGERSDRLEEAIQVMRAMWGPGPASFDGRYYRLEEVDFMPKPAPGRPWLIVGGSGAKRTLPTAARYADEWNLVSKPPAAYAELAAALDERCEAIGRDPKTLKRSMMAIGLLGANEQAVNESAAKAALFIGRGQLDGPELRRVAGERGLIGGTTDEVVDHLGQLAELGIQEVEFEHLDFDDDTVPEYIAAEIIPRVRDL